MERPEHSQSVIYHFRKAVEAEKDDQKKIFILYLISDCLHHVLKMRPMDDSLDEFSEATLFQLEKIIQPMYNTEDDKTKSKVKQVLSLL